MQGHIPYMALSVSVCGSNQLTSSYVLFVMVNAISVYSDSTEILPFSHDAFRAEERERERVYWCTRRSETL